MKKKNLLILKAKQFLVQYPIIIFLQHNNLKVDQWSQLRVQVNNIKNSDIFLFKNKIMKMVLLEQLDKYKNQTNYRFILNQNEIMINFDCIFQGPCFAFGCEDIAQLKNLLHIVNSTSNVVLIGGIYSNQVLNHIDITKLVNLNSTNVYSSFIETLNYSNSLYILLQRVKNFQVIEQVQLNLLNCLLELKKIKTG